jgi:hypothetical protein
VWKGFKMAHKMEEKEREDCTTILNKSFWSLDSSPALKI